MLNAGFWLDDMCMSIKPVTPYWVWMQCVFSIFIAGHMTRSANVIIIIFF